MQLGEYKRVLTTMVEKRELPLPAQVSPEAFKNAAIVAFTDNPKVASCSPESLFKSIRTLAAMGLVPDGKEAALVPFKTKVNNQFVEVCQAVPMVFGLIKRARNSAEVRDIRAHLVYQNEIDQERFEYVVGDEERLEHRPILFGQRGPAVACYAIAVLKDGQIIREFMNADEIDKVRRAGSSQKIFQKGQRPTVSDEPIGIWKDWGEEMWKKTAIRRLCKRLSMSSEDLRMIQQSEGDEFAEMQDVTPARKTMNQRLAEALDQTPEGEPEDFSQDVADAEVLPPEDSSALKPTPENAFPGSDEYDQGVTAYGEDVPYENNPYAQGGDQQKVDDWAGGWIGAQAACE